MSFFFWNPLGNGGNAKKKPGGRLFTLRHVSNCISLGNFGRRWILTPEMEAVEFDCDPNCVDVSRRSVELFPRQSIHMLIDFFYDSNRSFECLLVSSVGAKLAEASQRKQAKRHVIAITISCIVMKLRDAHQRLALALN